MIKEMICLVAQLCYAQQMIQPTRTVTLNFRDHRNDPSLRVWDLPQWGHDASMMVMPLFISVNERMIPVGSAFSIGSGLGFVMTASHNIMEAVSHDSRFDGARTAGHLSGSINLSNVGLSVLHQRTNAPGNLQLSFLPLRSIEGAPPTDIVVGFAEVPDGTPSLSVPLSFAIPERGDTVWSLGYCDFKYPDGGIPIEAVRNGTFDWLNDYSHCLRVVEATVEAAFTSQFATGFLDGPCFAFDDTITHGMSGGPVLSETGYLVGLNSAGANTFFERPMSIASMLYPLLLTNVRFGRTFGPLTMNAIRPFFELIGQGIIRTDGSEERIGITDLNDEGLRGIHATAPIDASAIFENFAAYRDDRRAPSVDTPTYHLACRPAVEMNRVGPSDPSPAGEQEAKLD